MPTETTLVRHAAPSGRRARPTRRSGAWHLADAALTLAAIGGVICVAAVVAATFFDITLIMFKTGSMSPTIPAGSLAVVREIPASEAAVGDVVTVDRTDLLPITHRITSVTDAGNGFTTITMRGDANLDEDPEPYVVQNVRTVLFSVPGLATAVVAFSNPYVLGGVTFGAAALVTWAFWPRGARRAHRAGAGAAAVLVLVIAPAAIAPEPARAASPAQSAPVAEPAGTAEVETVVRGEYLTLRSIADPDAMESMTPGRPVQWQVGVSVAPPDPGTVHVGISAEGGLVNPGALDLEVRACDTRWAAGACAGRESTWLPFQDIAQAAGEAGRDGVRVLDTLDSSNATWLLITAVMPIEAAPGSEARLSVHAWGEADAVPAAAGSPGEAAAQPERRDAIQIGARTSTLAYTGAPVGTSVLLALGAISGGLALSGAARVAALAGARRRDREAVVDGAPHD